jgi:hypothetical protein
VHGSLEQQREDGGPDVEPGAAASTARTSRTGAAWTERAAGAGAEVAEREPAAESAAGPAETEATHAVAVSAACILVEPHDYLQSVVDSSTIYRQCIGRKGFFREERLRRVSARANLAM